MRVLPFMVVVGYLSIEEFWGVIERPLLEFVTLGIIPGTDYQLSFELTLLLGLLILLIFLLWEHISSAKKYIKSAVKRIEHTAI